MTKECVTYIQDISTYFLDVACNSLSFISQCNGYKFQVTLDKKKKIV